MARVPGGPLGDVYGALVQLGYKPGEIEPLIDAMDPARPVADLVREALGGAAEALGALARIDGAQATRRR